MVLVQIARIDREAQYIEIQLPLPPKERIAIYKYWIGRCDWGDGDKIYLLPTLPKINEIGLVAGQYGYGAPENFPKLMEMGTPENIMQYISNQWGGGARTTKLQIRMDWYKFWSQQFPEYALDCYQMFSNIPSTGYGMSIGLSTYIAPLPEPINLKPAPAPRAPAPTPIVEPTLPAITITEPILPSITLPEIPEIPVAIAIGLAGLAFALLQK